MKTFLVFDIKLPGPPPYNHHHCFWVTSSRFPKVPNSCLRDIALMFSVTYPAHITYTEIEKQYSINNSLHVGVLKYYGDTSLVFEKIEFVDLWKSWKKSSSVVWIKLFLSLMNKSSLGKGWWIARASLSRFHFQRAFFDSFPPCFSFYSNFSFSRFRFSVTFHLIFY